MKAVRDRVYSYPTESEMGFTLKELELLTAEFPDLDKEKYNSALYGITCMANEKGEMIIYHCDVYKALCCGIQKRGLKGFEWD
jgi:hypothetical protein